MPTDTEIQQKQTLIGKEPIKEKLVNDVRFEALQKWFKERAYKPALIHEMAEHLRVNTNIIGNLLSKKRHLFESIAHKEGYGTYHTYVTKDPATVDLYQPTTCTVPKQPNYFNVTCMDKIAEFFLKNGNAWATIYQIINGTSYSTTHLQRALSSENFESRKYRATRLYRLNPKSDYATAAKNDPAQAPLKLEVSEEEGEAKSNSEIDDLLDAPENQQTFGQGMTEKLSCQGPLSDRSKFSPDGMSEEIALHVGCLVAIEMTGANPDGAKAVIDKYWREFKEGLEPLTPAEILEQSVHNLGLLLRTANSLESVGIFTLNQLLRTHRTTLLVIPGFGLICLKEVVAIATIWKDYYQRALHLWERNEQHQLGRPPGT